MGRTSRHLERTGTDGSIEGLRAQRGTATWRIVAGVALLAALLGFCGLLARPYYQNWRLQRYLETVAFEQARRTQPTEMFVADIAEQSARLGLPVGADQIRITKTESGMFVELRYFVRVDLLLYTVDLHFRPAAGAR